MNIDALFIHLLTSYSFSQNYEFTNEDIHLNITTQIS